MNQLPNILKFIGTFPQADLIFAYGSAVQPQKNYDYQKQPPMIDLLIAVDDIQDWHHQNLKVNPKHYSGLSYYFGSKYIELMNNQIFPIHFSPFVKYDQQQFKYGVVSSRLLIRDLEDWRWMTLAGRMQKPISIIQEWDNPRFHLAYQQNLIQAIAVSLLIDFKTQISIDELLFNIVSLSYIGDIRMTLGAENQNKIVNILEGNYEKIKNLYMKVLLDFKPLLEIDKNMITLEKNTKTQQLIDFIEYFREALCQMVPSRLPNEYLGEGKDFMRSVYMMDSQKVSNVIQQCLENKNSFSSKRMLLYNMLSISPFLGVKYGLQKVGKRLNGK